MPRASDESPIDAWQDGEEFKEFELEGNPARRFFTAAIGHANTDHR
jgi:hypothetical protein